MLMLNLQKMQFGRTGKKKQYFKMVASKEYLAVATGSEI